MRNAFRSVCAAFLLVTAVVSVQATYGFGQKHKPSAAPDGVWVVRPTDAVSCGAGQGADSLDKASVHVLKKYHRDGKGMHIQMCGASTGEVNAFLVPRADMEKARAIEFKEADADLVREIGAAIVD